MLAIFDIDGTICDTQKVESECYAAAILEVAGIPLETLDWSNYKDPTSSGIIRTLLENDSEAAEKESRIERRFVELLRKARPDHPADFTPIPGAVEFIERLSRDRICDVAIATGGFSSEAEFKLACCGIDLQDFPHATSSDTPSRREILPLAAQRAGAALSSCVYFGDAPWDVNASRVLGVPMIGIGRRIEQLAELEVLHVFRDFSDSDAVIRALVEQN